LIVQLITIQVEIEIIYANIFDEMRLTTAAY